MARTKRTSKTNTLTTNEGSDTMTAKATDLRVGAKVHLRRTAVYASSGATKNRETVKRIVEISEKRNGFNRSFYVVKFAGSYLRGTRALKSFRIAIDEHGDASHVSGSKIRYEVLGIETPTMHETRAPESKPEPKPVPEIDLCQYCPHGNCAECDRATDGEPSFLEKDDPDAPKMPKDDRPVEERRQEYILATRAYEFHKASGHNKAWMMTTCTRVDIVRETGYASVISSEITLSLDGARVCIANCPENWECLKKIHEVRGNVHRVTYAFGELVFDRPFHESAPYLSRFVSEAAARELHKKGRPIMREVYARHGFQY